MSMIERVVQQYRNHEMPGITAETLYSAVSGVPLGITFRSERAIVVVHRDGTVKIPQQLCTTDTEDAVRYLDIMQKELAGIVKTAVRSLNNV